MSSLSTFIYVYIYIYMSVTLWTPAIQDGVSYCYMDSVFELVANEESEIWISLPHSFMKRGLLQSKPFESR